MTPATGQEVKRIDPVPVHVNKEDCLQILLSLHPRPNEEAMP